MHFHLVSLFTRPSSISSVIRNKFEASEVARVTKEGQERVWSDAFLSESRFCLHVFVRAGLLNLSESRLPAPTSGYINGVSGSD